MNDKVISLLGLAERAGKIASGEFAAEKAVKTGKARLIIVAEDASDNTKKKFSDMCKYYQVPFACYSQKELLGHGIGKDKSNYASGYNGRRSAQGIQKASRVS